MFFLLKQNYRPLSKDGSCLYIFLFYRNSEIIILIADARILVLLMPLIKTTDNSGEFFVDGSRVCDIM